MQTVFPLSNGLCPRIGQEITVGGKVTSKKDFFRVKLVVKRCDTKDPTCADDLYFQT